MGDLLLLILLLTHLPVSLQLPKAFDHPLHRPQSFTYHQYNVNPQDSNPDAKEASLPPSLPKELVVNPTTLEAFDHPVHTPHRHHDDHHHNDDPAAIQEVTRTRSSHPHPGYPIEVYLQKYLSCLKE